MYWTPRAFCPALTLTTEVLDTPPATIGKGRACELHRIMGKVGLPHAQQYAFAAAALGEWTPLPTLSDLTEAEARAVWTHLSRLYPAARAFAA